MRVAFLTGVLLMAASAGCAGRPDLTPPKTGTAKAPKGIRSGEWKLAWSDEFDYEGLPDKAKWDYEEGFVRNHEMQYYTRSRKENARVENGMLVIEARKEEFKNPKYEAGSPRWSRSREFAEITSASLTTRNKFSWKYGRVEVRAKLPQGQGVWPAIWTLGNNITEVRWPRCGEIDIMEFVGREPNHIHGTVHYSVNGEHVGSGEALETQEPFADFHVYAIEWDSDHIDFFFDDTRYFTFSLDKAGTGDDNPFRKPHYLLINLALGGDWGGEVDDSIFPQKYYIDYVRVYEKTGQ
jgi:beta-glucanase (GH16 family)